MKRAGIDFVDPTPWFCAYDVCPVVIGSDLAYRDREHISTAYSTKLADVGRTPSQIALATRRQRTQADVELTCGADCPARCVRGSGVRTDSRRRSSRLRLLGHGVVLRPQRWSLRHVVVDGTPTPPPQKDSS